MDFTFFTVADSDGKNALVLPGELPLITDGNEGPRYIFTFQPGKVFPYGSSGSGHLWDHFEAPLVLDDNYRLILQMVIDCHLNFSRARVFDFLINRSYVLTNHLTEAAQGAGDYLKAFGKDGIIRQ